MTSLDGLLELIEILRERIGKHSQSLQQNEIRTRYALVDPFLAALGWAPGDPTQVVPEYTVGQAKRADYALFGSPRKDTPAVFLEVNALRRPLSEGLEQSINYCIQEGVGYFAVTDGAHLEVYDIYRQGRLPDKKIVEFGVDGDPINLR